MDVTHLFPFNGASELVTDPVPPTALLFGAVSPEALGPAMFPFPFTTGDGVAALQGRTAHHGAYYLTQGFYAGARFGGGTFFFDATRAKSGHNGGTVISPTVTWDGTAAGLANFLNATTETDPGGLGCWVRPHGEEVYISWFGAKCDATRPSTSVPDGNVGGTNDTLAVTKCRDYLQTVAFQPNNYTGFWGGYRLCFEPNRAVYLKGHNPLGSSRPRNDVDGSPGQLARQNWVIDGKGALICWEVEDEDDCLIESHEAFTLQYYSHFRVFIAKCVGRMGIFYSNVAYPGRNATIRHKFERVECYHPMQANNSTHGWKYMFRYTGTNLGDRLITEQCAFQNAHTMFYSENLEAVQQSFISTSFSSYLDDAIFFHLRRHGSTFTFSAGCGFLMKGNDQVLFRTEHLDTPESGVANMTTYMDCKGSRLECEDGKPQTLAECDFGNLEIDGFTMAAGGLPHPESKAVVVRKVGMVRIRNSFLYGRFVVGLPSTTVYGRRSHFIRLSNCTFAMDAGKALFVEASDGTLIPWRTALAGDYQVPGVVIEGSDTANFFKTDGSATSAGSFVFDGVYPGGMQFNTIPHAPSKIVVARKRANGFHYLDNRSYIALPPFSVITSIKITHGQNPVATLDTMRVSIGAATFDYAYPDMTRRRQYEILPAGQVIVISDDDEAQRTVSTQPRLAGAAVVSPSIPALLEIEWRPAYGLNEITTTEVGGVRLTRLAGA